MNKKNLYRPFILVLIGALLIVAEYLMGEAEESKSFSIRITGYLLEGKKTNLDPSIRPVFTPDGKYVIVNADSKDQFVITTEGKIVNKTPQALQKNTRHLRTLRKGYFLMFRREHYGYILLKEQQQGTGKSLVKSALGHHL